jgi:DNA polymerase-4
MSRASKSISRETTFERDLHARHDRAALSAILTALCERLAEDLRRKGYVSRTISVKLRYDDFQIVSRNVTLPQPVAEADAILHAVRACLKRVPLQRKLRLLGVRASTLAPPGAMAAAPQPVQGELFG